MDELGKKGIRTLGVSSDGDTRLLSAMCENVSSRIIAHTTQDTIHILTKMRTRLLRGYLHLQLGDQVATGNHLKILLRNVPKTYHGLIRTSLSLEDKQNFASVEKIMSQRVKSNLTQHVPHSDATAMYLQLMTNINESFNADLPPLERIYKIWFVVYFFRIWYIWLDSQQKYKLSENFITLHTLKCIELNAHALVDLTIELKDTPDLYQPTEWNSQSCEHFFRRLRSMGTTNYTKINFSLYEVFHQIGRLEIMNDILHANLNNANIVFPKLLSESHEHTIYYGNRKYQTKSTR